MTWEEVGINVRGRTAGHIKTTCPRCSSQRKNRRDPCLSVDVSEGIWKCHHCGWAGSLKGRGSTTSWQAPRVYTKPKFIPMDPTEKMLAWFQTRGISPDVVIRNRIGTSEVWMNTETPERAIAFPYYRDGEVINVKYRTADKRFRLETGAELVLYGLDDIAVGEPLIVVEGEMDKLACEVAGYRSCVSVPNGAGTNLDVLASAETKLDSITKIIAAGDDDEPGRRLMIEVIRRLGAERCYRVFWPGGCKDANEVLLEFGVERLKHEIETARPVPIEGAFEVTDFSEQLYELYEFGRPSGEHPGWDCLNELYRPRTGEWSAVTGIPGSGKSGLVNALAVNLAVRNDWQFAVFPAEHMPPEEYASALIELYTGLPFNRGPHERMDLNTMYKAAQWVHDHFVILNPDDGERNLDSLLQLARAYVLRRGIKGLVIDPWNELEHFQDRGQSETQYISQSLVRIRHFCRTYGVHTWIVAHPTKIPKNADGKYGVVSPYDISGSAAWYNKADMIISVWRDKSDDARPVELHVQKIRFRWCGHLGVAQLYYNQMTGRYSEGAPIHEACSESLKRGS